MTGVYQIVSQKYDMNTAVTFKFIMESVTRGDKYKLKQSHCKYDLRKHFFINKISAI